MTTFEKNYTISQNTAFQGRHIGANLHQTQSMLGILGESNLEEFISKVIPSAIVRTDALQGLPLPQSEQAVLSDMAALAAQNQTMTSMIGQGYYGTHTPSVILRNVLENPAWYTAYTPYQPEISQGRLEALLNFQTMVTDLTGMELANASLLDEGTAAVEAMLLCWRQTKSAGKSFFVDQKCHPQTIDLILARAEPLEISVIIGSRDSLDPAVTFGALFQYPDTTGHIQDYTTLIEALHAQGGMVVMATDLLALTILKSPAEMGADIAIGSAQRFGVPMGFGGPHAAFFATKDAFKRHIPGRLVGVSVDSSGKKAYRLA